MLDRVPDTPLLPYPKTVYNGKKAYTSAYSTTLSQLFESQCKPF